MAASKQSRLDAPELRSPVPDSGGQSALLAMEGIVKRYGATAALSAVDFDVRAGEIHALLGENGAGKSTLMHVLAGRTRPDAGTIRMQQTAVTIRSPREARSLGIAMVHQHFTLAPALTVAENLALDSVSDAPLLQRILAGARYSPLRAAHAALERARELGWELPAAARVSELPVGTQQRVEIVKALATRARLLIFDEPTAVLAGSEVEELFAVLRRLRDEGCAVVLIAHKLAEIMAVADRVTVLRRGRRVASENVRDTDTVQLAAWMIGGVPETLRAQEENEPEAAPSEQTDAAGDSLRAVEAGAPGNKPGIGFDGGPAAAFTAHDLVIAGDRGEKAVLGLSMQVRHGEIFGIGGVDGNGQTELAEALVGLRGLLSGRMLWNGAAFAPGSAPTLGYIPQDRRRSGLAVSMSIRDNLLFDAVREPAYRSGPFLKRAALHKLADDLITQFDIRTASANLPVSALSGGNQQKIVVARTFRTDPNWIVAVNPTRGLDIGATRFVHAQLRRARDRGAAVVVISTDLDEIAALADRAAILSKGALTETRIETGREAEIGLLLGGLGAAASRQGGKS